MMNFITDYIQPFTGWLETHPHWALFFAFLISFSESLAIIGSIIPGSITMTAIGFLAGSGIMRVDLTLIAATLGAIAGDSLSYLLGYIFSEKIPTIWPFYNNPKWLTYGKAYFERHGGKSVIIGRFIGPLRSIIPVIAGMMHMSQWRFLTANIISGIGWALLYVLPGILIGTASNELSPESATRLFVFILIFLVGIWFISTGIKWLITMLGRYLRVKLHGLWVWASQQPILSSLVKFITPRGELNYFNTAILFLSLFISVLSFLIITYFVMKGSFNEIVDKPVFFFLQSLRLYSFDIFFIFIGGFFSILTLMTLFFLILIVTIYYKEWRSMNYWLSLHFSCFVIMIITYATYGSHLPQSILEIPGHDLYPLPSLTLGTAQFTALLCYLNNNCKCSSTRILNIFLPALLFLGGLTPLYLGDSWIMDSIGGYLCGCCLFLLHWIFYRCKPIPTYQPCFALLILASLLSLSSITFYLNVNQSIRLHKIYQAQYVLIDKLWWKQTNPLLPLYRTNRIGKPISLFNIQYSGDLNDLEISLLNAGWHKENESLLTALLNKINHPAIQPIQQDSPLMAQLYLNRKPVLVMTLRSHSKNPAQILRIWRSNYHLKNFKQPIWLGTVNNYTYLKSKKESNPSTISSLTYVITALPQFKKRIIRLSTNLPINLPYPYEPKLLLIKSAPPLKME